VTITVNRAVLKFFLDMWKRELFVNFDKAERISGLKTAIDNVPFPLLKQAADDSNSPELVTFELVDTEKKLWQILKAPSIP
jgi:hypothetical protein